MTVLFSRILSLATGATPVERSQLSCKGVSSLNCAGASPDAPAASWEEWQRWAARAPHGQKRERQRTLVEFTAHLLREELRQ